MAQKIPATVITGFLGAGKTSIIRHLLENANGRRIALIINEFGDVGIDGEILRGCGIEGCEDEDILELANGCICCTVADDFVPTMEALLGRERKPDQIVIETSGLALPKPLVKAFNWPDIRTRVTVDAVVTVVDGPAVAGRPVRRRPAGGPGPARGRRCAGAREPAGGAVRGAARLRGHGRHQQGRPARRQCARRGRGGGRGAAPAFREGGHGRSRRRGSDGAAGAGIRGRGRSRFAAVPPRRCRRP